MILESHREIWKQKKLLRLIYREWYKDIIKNTSKVEGRIYEIGGGSGNFKEFFPNVISTDVESCEWLDMVFDAHKMPLKSKHASNFVMVDVFHHLQNPVLFLKEAHRVLKKTGRIIMIEPYPTIFSLFIYKKFHPEPFIFDIDYFNMGSEIKKKDAWASNQAIPYLMFFKYKNDFESIFKIKLKIIRREKFSFLLYPLSGGFENKQLIPDSTFPYIKGLESLLKPFRDILAFRCMVILEKV
jgi:SAM-dependent methyltransferase